MNTPKSPLSIEVSGLGTIELPNIDAGALFATCIREGDADALRDATGLLDALDQPYAIIPYTDMGKLLPLSAQINEAVLAGFRGTAVILPASGSQITDTRSPNSVISELLMIKDELAMTPVSGIIALANSSFKELAEVAGITVITGYHRAESAPTFKSPISESVMSHWIDGLEQDLNKLHDARHNKGGIAKEA